jgi:hypothetical protein
MLYDSSSGEEGIWKVQLKKIRESLKKSIGLKNEHESGIKYLDQRIGYLALYLVLIVAFIILFTASSPYLTYGSMGFAILGTFLWGALRIKHILALKELRKVQARNSDERSQSNVNKRMQSDAAEPRR